jgi:hypothetical protein
MAGTGRRVLSYALPQASTSCKHTEHKKLCPVNLLYPAHPLPPACSGPELPLEDFNHYALLLDVDGNAWSDRYRLLAHFNTPVLKQASNLTAFFEHVMAPGAVVEQYSADLSDLPVRARQLLGELRQQPDRLMRMAGEGGAPAFADKLHVVMH